MKTFDVVSSHDIRSLVRSMITEGVETKLTKSTLVIEPPRDKWWHYLTRSQVEIETDQVTLIGYVDQDKIFYEITIRVTEDSYVHAIGFYGQGIRPRWLFDHVEGERLALRVNMSPIGSV